MIYLLKGKRIAPGTALGPFRVYMSHSTGAIGKNSLGIIDIAGGRGSGNANMETSTILLSRDAETFERRFRESVDTADVSIVVSAMRDCSHE